MLHMLRSVLQTLEVLKFPLETPIRMELYIHYIHTLHTYITYITYIMSRDGKVTSRGTLCTEPSSCNTNHVERCIRTMPL